MAAKSIEPRRRVVQIAGRVGAANPTLDVERRPEQGRVPAEVGVHHVLVTQQVECSADLEPRRADCTQVRWRRPEEFDRDILDPPRTEGREGVLYSKVMQRRSGTKLD